MYFKVLGLNKEPFSTSPDPGFFYHSPNHDTALKRLEIALRLRRGLSLVLGDVGTGKTTLSRALLQKFQDDEDYVFHIILDPGFKNEFQFLVNLIKVFGISPVSKDITDLKESLERYLFRKGVEENKTVVLIIDESQKMTLENLEVLRTLLNYETNEYKLLQLVIMGQMELLPRVEKINNFMDRVALKYIIRPLSEEETKNMIEFRIRQAGYRLPNNLFTDEAIKLIHQQTQGYPRKIAMFCRSALEAIVVKDCLVVDAQVVHSLINEEVSV